MIKYYTFFFLLYFSNHLVAQDYNLDISNLHNKSHAERTLMLTPFYEYGINDLDSIAIFSTISKIEKLAHKNADNELVLEAGLMRAHYYMYRGYFKKDFVIQNIEALNNIAKKNKIWWLEIRTESLLANYLYNYHRDYGRGFEHFERTAQLLEGISGKDFPLKKICLYQLGAVYYEFHEYESAVRYLKKSEQTTSNLNSYYYQMHITNTLGAAYRKINKMDSSFYYFNKTIEKAIKSEDKIWQGLSSGNIGYNHFLVGNYWKAIPFLELDYNIAKDSDDPGWLSDALSNLAANNLALKNIDKAQVYIDQAYLYAQNSEQYKRFTKIFPIKAKLAAYSSKPELASIYLDSTLIVIDSLNKIFDTKKILLAKQRIAIEKKQLKDEKKSLLNSRRLYRRNGIIVVLILLIFIGLLLYNRKKLRHQNKIQTLDTEKQLALQKLSLATNRLEDFKRAMFNKNKTIKQLEEVVTLSNGIDSKKSLIHKQFDEIAILTEKDWRDFVALFEEVHIGFFDRLKVKLPNLSPTETKLIAISRLQLDNKEMALMLGVGTSAIRQVKSRLRKKNVLQEGQSLQDLATSI